MHQIWLFRSYAQYFMKKQPEKENSFYFLAAANMEKVTFPYLCKILLSIFWNLLSIYGLKKPHR